LQERKTLNEHIVEFVLDRYSFSRTNLASQYERWREFYFDYRATRAKNKMPWQANYVIPVLRDIVRTKVPLYMNILFPQGAKSFDIVSTSPEDEDIVPILKQLLVYQLENVGRGKGGFFAQVESFLKQFEVYGYAVCKIPWCVERDEKGKVVYEGPDIEVLSLFDFFPDPDAIAPLDSWVIIRKRNVPAHRLRRLASEGIYKNLELLADTHQPADELGFHTTAQSRNLVELLEFHGEVPRSFLEGRVTDEVDFDPYNDEYVLALITIANRKACIRAEPYPYDAGLIFVDATKDRMPEEAFGYGSGEDVQALSEALVNAHNKLTDCINLISNPMFIVNPQKVAGVTGGHLIACPGKVFMVNAGIERVDNAIMPVPMSAQVGALTPLINLILMLKEEIMKIAQSVPAIAPMPTRQGMHQTLGGTLLMQGNAIEPIKHVVRHCLEPWFERVLQMFYKHNLQFFDREAAYRVLSKEDAKLWEEERKKKDVTRADIKLSGNPRFVPRGVSIFSERQGEVQALLNFLQVAGNVVLPVTDALGNPVVLPDGTPVTEPAVDVREIIRRLAIALGIEDLDNLIPSLRREREMRIARQRAMKRAQEMLRGGEGAEQRAGTELY